MNDATAIRPSAKKKRYKFTTLGWIGIVFIFPAFAFTLLFEYYPMLDGIYHSFFRWNGSTVERFVGLENFIRIFKDSAFWTSVYNMLFFLFFNILLMFPTIIACIVMFRIKSERVQYFYRLLYCLPMVIPGVVVMLLWKFLYNPQFGLINQMLAAVGLDKYQQLWLADPALAKWSLLLTGFPFISTIAALIYLGGLQSIDSGIWDAGKIDGVGWFRKMTSLELPLIAGQFKLNLIGVLAGTITGYSTQLIMTNGGPGYSTLVPGLYMYQNAFSGTQSDYGYASAVGLVLFVVALIISLASMKFIRSDH